MSARCEGHKLHVAVEPPREEASPNQDIHTPGTEGNAKEGKAFTSNLSY